MPQTQINIWVGFNAAKNIQMNTMTQDFLLEPTVAKIHVILSIAQGFLMLWPVLGFWKFLSLIFYYIYYSLLLEPQRLSSFPMGINKVLRF